MKVNMRAVYRTIAEWQALTYEQKAYAKARALRKAARIKVEEAIKWLSSQT